MNRLLVGYSAMHIVPVNAFFVICFSCLDKAYNIFVNKNIATGE